MRNHGNRIYKLCRAEGLEISFSSCIIYPAGNCTVSIVCFAICCVVPNGQGKTATITTTHPAGRFGILQMDYAAGRVRSFQEKGDQKQAWVNAGFAVFNNEGNIRLLAAHGYQVHAAANFENGSTVSDERLEQLQRSYKKAGIGVYHIPIPRKVWNLKALILSYIQIRQLSSRHYTLIHCHSPIGGVLARAAAVRQLCRNPDRRRRMGIFNRRRIERFSAQVVEKKMADVYGVKI